jgi:hypothetical protein
VGLVNAGMRTIKGAAQKGPAGSRARPRDATKMVANPRRPHGFFVNHLREDDFKSYGLRRDARCRDLGVKDATHGAAVIHVG